MSILQNWRPENIQRIFLFKAIKFISGYVLICCHTVSTRYRETGNLEGGVITSRLGRSILRAGKTSWRKKHLNWGWKVWVGLDMWRLRGRAMWKERQKYSDREKRHMSMETWKHRNFSGNSLAGLCEKQGIRLERLGRWNCRRHEKMSNRWRNEWTS